ncbi:MAG: prepilin-type N-terminal cleavage/methylation domain-containing protein [Candidatus Dadabacteria bacterium]|nr:prepilin-type N-terminal cleavage/methylation domain-containing protein [Candidatus Dadabacteria bacterium]NIS07355.1 prepilin-type N-terminal cleavage/methylation domain-containing protein [Candidatus Dadabacteria bacterium]NIV41299.1 prepilin-type N-terminal cleavage/methylation domain-containing protein [Candidatus Dadabacteria bacterium]NIX14534.1 prepilin-type N-terminal cleavage/methylation domain-containing protein [Candidatus Dadabacteria bacterium]NIY20992.1 prepilin-type N-terminal
MTKRTLKSHLQWQTTRSGFTLIEVLIALFLGSIIFTVLFASFFQIMKSKEIAETELELYHESRVILARMTKDLSSIYPRGNIFLARSNYTTTEPYFEGGLENDQSWIRFTSLSRAPSYNKSDSDQAKISYYVQKIEDENTDRENQLFSLFRRENPYIGGSEDGTAYSLSDRILLFRINYLSGDDLESEDAFSELWNSNENLSVPRAVEISFVLRGPEQKDVEFKNLVYLQLSK